MCEMVLLGIRPSPVLRQFISVKISQRYLEPKWWKCTSKGTHTPQFICAYSFLSAVAQANSTALQARRSWVSFLFGLSSFFTDFVLLALWSYGWISH